jgi:HD-GYP domain-containing protein (c-di-GMP phosphodiesterase class II)
MFEVVLMAGVLALGAVGLLMPSVVPSVPEPASAPAIAALAAGSVFYLLVGLRALGTFALTRRTGDLVVAIGISWLGAALPAALLLSYRDLGWWLGHGFELVGLVLVGVPVALDLFRTAQSRPLVGDLHAAELVAAEQTFLGAHVRALTVRLAQKDEYTEEHTRRVALRAVQVGEELGLPPGRLRALAIGGLMHDIGKLSVPDRLLKKPAELSEEEFAVIRQHPEWGERLVSDLGGFTAAVRRLVLDHHERLDGSGYPRGLTADQLELDTRILAVCDVYDALISTRVYRAAWSHEEALALLHEEAGITLDPACVIALEQVLAHEHGTASERAAKRPTSARQARTRPATPAAETS